MTMNSRSNQNVSKNTSFQCVYGEPRKLCQIMCEISSIIASFSNEKDGRKWFAVEVFANKKSQQKVHKLGPRADSLKYRNCTQVTQTQKLVPLIFI